MTSTDNSDSVTGTGRVPDAQLIIEELHDQVRELMAEGGRDDEVEDLMALAKEVADGTARFES